MRSPYVATRGKSSWLFFYSVSIFLRRRQKRFFATSLFSNARSRLLLLSEKHASNVTQIMRVHKKDDGDRGGKRIASEPDRRYILTPAPSGGSSGGGGGGVGNKGSAAAMSSTGAARGVKGGAPGTGKIRARFLVSRAVGVVVSDASVEMIWSLCWAGPRRMVGEQQGGRQARMLFNR